MAETTKVVVLSVELDLSQFSKNADEAAAAIDEIQKKQAVLQVQGKQNTQEYAALSAQLQKTRKDLRDNANAVQTVTKLQKQNTGSIREMREELSVATLRWNNLSKSQRDNVNVGGKLQGQIKNLSNELKKNESAIGDNRRNVGNYQQAIQGALQQTNLFGGSLGQLSGLISSGGVFGIAIAGAIGLLKGLEAAFVATERGAELLERRSAGTSAALDVSVGTLAKMGESLENNPFFPTLSKTKQSLALLAALITGGKESLDQAKEAIQVAQQLTKRTQDLEDAERGLNVQVSENNVLIDKNLARAKNKGLSDQERIDLLTIAGEKEKENLEIQKRALDERLSIQQSINELEKRAKGQTSDDNLKILSDLQVEKNKLDQESLALLERIGARQSTIFEAAAKEKEASDNRQTASEEKKKMLIQKIGHSLFVDDYKKLLDERSETTELFVSQEEADIKNAYANKLIDEKEFNRQMAQLKITSAQAQLDLLIENSSTEIGTENEIAAKKIEIQKLLAEMLILINKQVDDSDKDLLDQKKQRTQALLGLTAQTLSAISQIQRNNTDEEINNINEEEARRLESIDKQIERRKDAGKSYEDLEKKRDKVEKDADKKSAALQKKQFARTKALQLAEATVLGAKATIAALGTPPAPNFILAAIAAAESALQIAVISSQKFKNGALLMPKAEKGMLIGGKPHSRGGTKFFGSDGTKFEAEKDEALIILNKRATDKMRYYSSLNYNSGGVDFYKGNKTSTYLEDGGFAARAATQPVLDQINSQQAFKDFPPIFVLVEDINSAQGKQAKVKSRSVFP